jgi:hypothetical protein
MKCRLLVNTILDGKFVERGSIVDDSVLSERLKTEAYVAYDLEDRGGKVLLLRDLSFMGLPRPSADGIPTSFPTHLAAGELLDLTQVPESKRKSLVEGLDYREKWTHDDLTAMRTGQQDIYASSDSLKAEPAVELETEPAVAPWRKK